MWKKINNTTWGYEDSRITIRIINTKGRECQGHYSIITEPEVSTEKTITGQTKETTEPVVRELLGQALQGFQTPELVKALNTPVQLEIWKVNSNTQERPSNRYFIQQGSHKLELTKISNYPSRYIAVYLYTEPCDLEVYIKRWSSNPKEALNQLRSHISHTVPYYIDLALSNLPNTDEFNQFR